MKEAGLSREKHSGRAKANQQSNWDASLLTPKMRAASRIQSLAIHSPELSAEKIVPILAEEGTPYVPSHIRKMQRAMGLFNKKVRSEESKKYDGPGHHIPDSIHWLDPVSASMWIPSGLSPCDKLAALDKLVSLREKNKNRPPDLLSSQDWRRHVLRLSR